MQLLRCLVALLFTVGAVAAIPQPASAAADNLVANGTFDSTSTSPWWQSGGSGFAVVSGRLCLNVQAGTASPQSVQFGQNGLSLTAGKRYLLTFDLRTTSPISAQAVVLQGGAPFLQQDLSTGVGLRRHVMDFTAQSGTTAAQLLIRVGGNAQGFTACVDNVSLTLSEKIINGTFDSSSTHPWWKRLASTSWAVDSGRLRVTTTNGPNTKVHNDLIGHFEFGVVAGGSYQLSFDAQASVARTMRVTVSRVDSPFTSAFDRYVGLTTTSQRFTFTFTSPFTDPSAVLLFHMGAAASSTIWFDNVSLTERPSPADDPVLHWNQVLRSAYKLIQGGVPTQLSRGGAMMHAAMYDAAISVTGQGQPFQSRVPVTYPPNVDDVVAPSLEAAINTAAYDMLKSEFQQPEVQSLFSSARTAAETNLPSGVNSVEVQRGTSVGAQAAAAIIQARAGDGSADDTPYTPDRVPGSWRETGSGAPVSPNWGRVRPFVLTAPSQFRPSLPNGTSSYAGLLADEEYESQLNEVRDLGRLDSANRTAEQREIAFYWANDLDGTYKPPGQLFDHTESLSAQRGLTLLDNARLFGLVGLALGDAAIAAWDSKYLTGIDLWRPETAIHLADLDGRPNTQPDPSWRPLSQNRDGLPFSPAFPAYVSGHATFAGAWAAVMRAYFGTDNMTFAGGTDDPKAIGVVRTFDTFTQAARENARSRVYLGVHFQFDADAGVATGLSVGDLTFARVLRP